jgi:hypothetical protein
MAVVEMIYVVAAVLWIAVVVTTVCVAGWLLLKVRARRRQVHRLLGVLALPLGVHRAAERVMRAYRPAPSRLLSSSRALVLRRIALRCLRLP